MLTGKKVKKLITFSQKAICMRRLVIKKSPQDTMDQSDIKYVLDFLNDAILDKDWDKVEEAREALKEFLDSDESSLEE